MGRDQVFDVDLTFCEERIGASSFAIGRRSLLHVLRSYVEVFAIMWVSNWSCIRTDGDKDKNEDCQMACYKEDIRVQIDTHRSLRRGLD